MTPAAARHSRARLQRSNSFAIIREVPGSLKAFLAVIDPCSDPEEVYGFFKSLKVPSVDFLLRDGNHERLPHGKHSFRSVEYGRWMSRLWELYVADPDPTPIECLDNLVRGMFGAERTKEGSGVTNYGILVVDTDGTITKNDTLKNSFDGADRFSGDWSVLRNSFPEVAEFNRVSSLQGKPANQPQGVSRMQATSSMRRRNGAAPLVDNFRLRQPLRILS